MKHNNVSVVYEFISSMLDRIRGPSISLTETKSDSPLAKDSIPDPIHYALSLHLSRINPFKILFALVRVKKPIVEIINFLYSYVFI